MRRLVASPWPYVLWAVVVPAALYGSYSSDPYVFGFTTLGLAWLTAPVALVGLTICLFSRRLRTRDRVLLAGALAIAVAALARAFAVLGTFEWA